VAASVPISQDPGRSPRYPDGRQVRIEFFDHARAGKREVHVVPARRSSFEWWQVLTGWMKAPKHAQEHQLDEFRNFLEKRNYSPKSCHSYLFMLKKFFHYLDEKRISQITPGVIEDYNYEFFVTGRYSRSYQLQFINGLSLYLEFVKGVRVNLGGLRKSEVKR
jgi:hypothetical protein